MFVNRYLMILLEYLKHKFPSAIAYHILSYAPLLDPFPMPFIQKGYVVKRYIASYTTCVAGRCYIVDYHECIDVLDDFWCQLGYEIDDEGETVQPIRWLMISADGRTCRTPEGVYASVRHLQAIDQDSPFDAQISFVCH